MRRAAEILVAAGSIPKPIEEETAKRGYMARELVQCTLPHSNPGDVEAYTRQDGNLTLGIRSGFDYKHNKRIGLPYGSIPRLLLLWMTSEANRTANPRIELGNTLNEFLREVGLDPNTGGGKRSDAKRLREQMLRLFMSEVSFRYAEGTQEHGGQAWLDMKVAPKGALWWDFRQPDNNVLFDSYIVLGAEFFQAITTNPVPIDLHIAGRLKRSPLALDLFVWTTYRIHRIGVHDKITVSYRDLHQQFGAEYGRDRNFKAALKDALDKVSGEWPAIRYELAQRGLVLHGLPKSALPIQAKAKPSRLSRQTREDPFDLSAADLMKASSYAPGWDVRAMRDEWVEWCKGQGIVPKAPVGHFISFLKTHKKRNG